MLGLVSKCQKRLILTIFFARSCSWFRFPVGFCILRKNLSYIYVVDTEEDDADWKIQLETFSRILDRTWKKILKK